MSLLLRELEEPNLCGTRQAKWLQEIFVGFFLKIQENWKACVDVSEWDFKKGYPTSFKSNSYLLWGGLHVGFTLKHFSEWK